MDGFQNNVKKNEEWDKDVTCLLYYLFLSLKFSHKIRTNNEIQGLKLNENSDKKYKIVQLAGDCKNMVNETKGLKVFYKL